MGAERLWVEMLMLPMCALSGLGTTPLLEDDERACPCVRRASFPGGRAT